MKKILPIVTILLLCAGCATSGPGEGNLFQRYDESRRLARAVDLLGEGNIPGAAKILTAICNAPAAPGVTDEALFRLALLNLRATPDRPASPHALLLLKRLKRDYPKSPWTRMAAPLADLIDAAEESVREKKALKATNQSLNREIGELNQRIEQLKHLDLELEKKSR